MKQFTEAGLCSATVSGSMARVQPHTLWTSVTSSVQCGDWARCSLGVLLVQTLCPSGVGCFNWQHYPSVGNPPSSPRPSWEPEFCHVGSAWPGPVTGCSPIQRPASLLRPSGSLPPAAVSGAGLLTESGLQREKSLMSSCPRRRNADRASGRCVFFDEY